MSDGMEGILASLCSVLRGDSNILFHWHFEHSGIYATVPGLALVGVA